MSGRRPPSRRSTNSRPTPRHRNRGLSPSEQARWNMSERVLFARVGMMSYYRGPQAGDERPVGGGRYNRTNIGHEAWNFDLRDGWYYGYVRSGSRDEGVRLDRIDAAAAHSDELDGVTIIFFAPKAGGGQVVVGWYRRAIVYRAAQREKTGSPPPSGCGAAKRKRAMRGCYRRAIGRAKCRVEKGQRGNRTSRMLTI